MYYWRCMVIIDHYIMISSVQGKIGPKGLPGPSGPKGEPVCDYNYYIVIKE